MSEEKGYDEAIAQRIRDECMSGDLESDHCDADEILCNLLKELGYTKTVEAWEAVGKWYA